tara:strand:- start:314 stop:892 length:579 start_codon:yes stop_codon:yes gene_type:complete
MAQGFLALSEGVGSQPSYIPSTTIAPAKHTEKEPLSLLKIVRDPVLCDIFEKFCVDELAGENFQFWRKVEAYRELDDEDLRCAEFNSIYDRFLDLDCETELNCSGLERIAIENARKSAVPSKDIFDEVQISVWVNLSTELLPRFQRSTLVEHLDLNSPLSVEEQMYQRKKLEDFFGMGIEVLLFDMSGRKSL